MAGWRIAFLISGLAYLVALLCWTLILAARSHEDEVEALDLRFRLIVLALVASLLLVGIVVWLQGGSALSGSASGGAFVLKHKYLSAPVQVSATHWLLSLAFESLVIGLVPLAWALLAYYYDPPWARGLITRAMVVFGSVWSLWIGALAMSQFSAWAAS